MSERGRLFVAIDLDDDVRSALACWRAGVASAHPGLRPVAEDALHLTLCFLGTCAMEDLDAIAAACAVRSGSQLTGLALAGVRWLPRHRPRVLAVAIEDGTGALARLQSALARALHAGGWYRPEARPYLAHVTVARVARDERPRVIPPPPVAALAAPTAVTVYRSHLSRQGARYEALRIVRVDGGACSPEGR